MAPKWPMRQNSSAKTALNSTEGAEIQCTWRPSENYRAESAITKRAAREQKHRLPLLRSDLDFYVWGIFQATHSNICWGWASSPRTRKTPGGSDRLPTPGTSTGTMSQVHAHTSLKKKKIPERTYSPLVSCCSTARIESYTAFLTQKFEAETSRWLWIIQAPAVAVTR